MAKILAKIIDIVRFVLDSPCSITACLSITPIVKYLEQICMKVSCYYLSSIIFFRAIFLTSSVTLLIIRSLTKSGSYSSFKLLILKLNFICPLFLSNLELTSSVSSELGNQTVLLVPSEDCPLAVGGRADFAKLCFKLGNPSRLGRFLYTLFLKISL